MKSYTLEIEIERDLDQVAKLFGDPDKLAYWQPGFLGIEPIGEQGPGGQKKYRLRYLHGKREMEMIETVELDALPDEYCARYEAKGMSMRVRNRFEALGDGRTRWITDNESQTSGLMMKILGILMPSCFKKESYKYMVNFKAFAETGADVRAQGG